MIEHDSTGPDPGGHQGARGSSDPGARPDRRMRPAGKRRRGMRRLLFVLAEAVLILAVAAGAIAASLWVTPMQEVSTAGQTVRVGVTAPTWSLSGPGEVDLFGQHLPTVVDFAGPVRPRLELRQIALGEQLAQFAASGTSATVHALQTALVHGWERFFLWQVGVAAAIAVLLFGAVAGWLRRGWGRTMGLIAIGLVVTVGLDAGAVMITAYTVPEKLQSVRSLQELVGSTPLPEPAESTGPAGGAIRKVVVIGDSTAAGLGNPIVDDPTLADSVCGRSRDAFAEVLAAANDWDVTNLACSRATIRAGLLGPQYSRSKTLPPQMNDPAVAHADLIIVSIGANDVSWSSILQMCALTDDCGNRVAQAYLQQQLADFSTDLLQLVTALQQLPHHPGVIINQYYDPFPDNITCLKGHGMTTESQKALKADLAALNSLLASAAKAAGFTTVKPDFSGHGVCSPYPYVQGLGDTAPFHPTAAGQLAIALADEHALRAAPQ